MAVESNKCLSEPLLQRKCLRVCLSVCLSVCPAKSKSTDQASEWPFARLFVALQAGPARLAAHLMDREINNLSVGRFNRVII